MDKTYARETALIREVEDAHRALMDVPPRAHAYTGHPIVLERLDLDELIRAQQRVVAAQTNLHAFWASDQD